MGYSRIERPLVTYPRIRSSSAMRSGWAGRPVAQHAGRADPRARGQVRRLPGSQLALAGLGPPPAKIVEQKLGPRAEFLARHTSALGHGCVAGRLVHSLVVLTRLALPEGHYGAEPGRPLHNDHDLGRDWQGDETCNGVEGQQTKENCGQDPCPGSSL